MIRLRFTGFWHCRGECDSILQHLACTFLWLHIFLLLYFYCYILGRVDLICSISSPYFRIPDVTSPIHATSHRSKLTGPTSWFDKIGRHSSSRGFPDGYRLKPLLTKSSNDISVFTSPIKAKQHRTDTDSILILGLTLWITSGKRNRSRRWNIILKIAINIEYYRPPHTITQYFRPDWIMSKHRWHANIWGWLGVSI